MQPLFHLKRSSGRRNQNSGVKEYVLTVLTSCLLLRFTTKTPKRRKFICENNNEIFINKNCQNAKSKLDLRNNLTLSSPYLLVCIASIMCYANSLFGNFVHDDLVAIVNNPDVTQVNSIGDLWMNDFWGKSLLHPTSHKSFRPLCVVTFRYVTKV